MNDKRGWIPDDRKRWCNLLLKWINDELKHSLLFLCFESNFDTHNRAKHDLILSQSDLFSPSVSSRFLSVNPDREGKWARGKRGEERGRDSLKGRDLAMRVMHSLLDSSYFTIFAFAFITPRKVTLLQLELSSTSLCRSLNILFHCLALISHLNHLVYSATLLRIRLDSSRLIYCSNIFYAASRDYCCSDSDISNNLTSFLVGSITRPHPKRWGPQLFHYLLSRLYLQVRYLIAYLYCSISFREICLSQSASVSAPNSFSGRHTYCNYPCYKCTWLSVTHSLLLIINWSVPFPILTAHFRFLFLDPCQFSTLFPLSSAFHPISHLTLPWRGKSN